MPNIYGSTFDATDEDHQHQSHHQHRHVHDPNLSSVAHDDDTSAPLRRHARHKSGGGGDDDDDNGIDHQSAACDDDNRPVAAVVDLQQLMPTVEDAELLYGFGLYGSAFRYDYTGDSLDVSLPSAGIGRSGDGDDVDDDATDMMLTTLLLDHRTAAVDGADRPTYDVEQQQQMQQHRSMLELAMMPLLAAVNDITARDELFQHQLSQNTCPGTHPASDFMLMDGQLPAAGDLMSAAALDISAINGFLDVDRSMSDDDARFAALSAALAAAVSEQTATEMATETTDPEATDEITVADSHVPSRAWASLPTSHLFIAQSPNNEFSVFAARPIAVRTRFGPLEGDLRSLLSAEMELMRSDSHRRLPVLFVNDSQLVDVANEYTSNWMRFVRLAHTYDEQNMLLHESADNRLHFCTSIPIGAHQELKVGYSPAYAKRYGLQPLHEPSVSTPPPPSSSLVVQPPSPSPAPRSPSSTAPLCLPHKPPALAICDTWPCIECTHKCDTFSALQLHLTAAHDQIAGINYPDRIARSLPQQRRRRRRRRMHRKVVTDGGRTVRYACRHCPAQVFSKYAALTRHCDRVHGGDLAADGVDDAMDDDADDDDDDDDDDGGGGAEDEGDVDSVAVIASATAVETGIVDVRSEPRPHIVVDKPTNDISTPRFRCVYCAQPYQTADALNAHVTPAHSTADGRFGCPQCRQSFGSYVKVRQHLNAVHTDAVHACPECGHRFKKPHIMERHRRIHAGDGGRHECAVCARRFQRRDKMLDHQRRMHPADGRERKRPGRPRRSVEDAAQSFVPAVAVAEDLAKPAEATAMTTTAPLQQRSRRKPTSTKRRPIEVAETGSDLLLGLVELNGLDLMAPTPEMFGMLPVLDRCDAMTTDNVVEYFEQQQQQQQQEQEDDRTLQHEMEAQPESLSPEDDVDGLHDDEVAAFTAAQSLANYCRSDERTDVAVYYADLAAQTQSLADHRPRQSDNNNNNQNATSDHPFGCCACRMRFKRRGMLVNHMARAHPTISLETVPALTEPIVPVQQQHRYACPYCSREYGSHSKRRLHIGKAHAGCAQPARLSEQAARNGGARAAQTVKGGGSDGVVTVPHPCAWCHKQYATRGRLLRHQRVAHA